MRAYFYLFSVLLILGCSPAAEAQAPSGATGQCQDGSYSTAAKKAGACRGHQGVQAWYASPAAPAIGSSTASPQAGTPVVTHASSTPAVVPTPAAAKSVSTGQPSVAGTQAQGGGPGLVWVNIPTKVYHCPGTRYYGKTKNGKYESEAQAQAEGDRADHATSCSK